MAKIAKIKVNGQVPQRSMTIGASFAEAKFVFVHKIVL